MRLHHRLMLILCGVSGLILGISLIVVHELVIRDELASLDRALLVAAHNAAHQYDRARGETALGGVVTLPEALAPTPSLIAVYDNAGALVRSSASFDGGAPDLSELGLGLDEPVPWEGAAAELTHDGTPLRGVVVPLRESGVLLYAASTSMVSEDRRFLLHSLPILFLLAMAVTATISRAVGRLLARDVERLAEAVGEIGRGNLDARVRHSVGGSRETAALAHGLDATAAQLKSLLESQRRFITDAAHELRSPLATLRGELQLALRRRRSEGEYREALTTAVEDVEELSELADELLALAKPRDLERSRGRVDVDAIVRAAIRLAEGGASLGGVDLRRRGEPEAYRAELCGHRPTLVRCLRNVIDNAIQHGSISPSRITAQGSTRPTRSGSSSPSSAVATPAHAPTEVRVSASPSPSAASASTAVSSSSTPPSPAAPASSSASRGHPTARARGVARCAVLLMRSRILAEQPPAVADRRRLRGARPVSPETGAPRATSRPRLSPVAVADEDWTYRPDTSWCFDIARLYCLEDLRRYR